VQPTTAVRPPKSRVSAQAIAVVAFATVAFAVLIGALAWALRSPTFAPRVEIVNETPYSVNVDVSSDRGRIGLGTVTTGSSLEFSEVLDEGDTWVFEFSYGGRDAGELSIERAALEEQDWTVDVPAEVGDDLESEGINPSAR
jgi:hypothetical protein